MVHMGIFSWVDTTVDRFPRSWRAKIDGRGGGGRGVDGSSNTLLLSRVQEEHPHHRANVNAVRNEGEQTL